VQQSASMIVSVARIVYFEVRLDGRYLSEFDDFHGDDGGDGEEGVAEDNKGEDVWCRLVWVNQR